MNFVECVIALSKMSKDTKAIIATMLADGSIDKLAADFEPKADVQPEKVNETAPRSRKKKGDYSAARWVDKDRLELWELFERFDWDGQLAPSWAKRFGRSRSAIYAQYTKWCIATGRKLSKNHLDDVVEPSQLPKRFG